MKKNKKDKIEEIRERIRLRLEEKKEKKEVE